MWPGHGHHVDEAREQQIDARESTATRVAVPAMAMAGPGAVASDYDARRLANSASQVGSISTYSATACSIPTVCGLPMRVMTTPARRSMRSIAVVVTVM